MTDMAPPIRYEAPMVMIAQYKGDISGDLLFTHAYQNIKITPEKEVISIGQIESMNVPKGWAERRFSYLPAGAGLVEYNPPGDNDVRIDSYYRGSRIDALSAAAFNECLSAPPHVLQSKELAGLSRVLGDKAINFDLFFARTEDLNGKRVLSVEGRYNDPNKTGAKTIYVDSDGTGSAIQEITFSAPGKEYTDYLSQGEAALKSIVWK